MVEELGDSGRLGRIGRPATDVWLRAPSEWAQKNRNIAENSFPVAASVSEWTEAVS
jgi:hypothetical protein